MRGHHSRREFLRLASGTTLSLLASGVRPRPALAEPAKQGGVLVVVFQRGAADGLHMAIPYREPRYRELRGALALEEPGRGDNPTLDLGGGFALHPALAPLYPLYQSDVLASVVNVGSTDPTRSHFDAQDYMESGTPGLKSTPDGWLTRALEATDAAGRSPFAGVALSARIPRSLAGSKDAIALADFRKLGLPERAKSLTERPEQMYRGDEDEGLASAGGEAFRAVEMFRAADPLSRPARAGVRYPRDPQGERFRQLAQLIKSSLGIRVAVVESEGWDTHFRQGSATGPMANLMTSLAGSMAALLKDVGPDVPMTLLTMTEFGRTVEINGAFGTDHGHGSVMIAAGAGVRGGKLHGDWLGLERNNLYEGRDLPVTTDFRDLFHEVATKSLELKSPELFPDYTPTSLGIMT